MQNFLIYKLKYGIKGFMKNKLLFLKFYEVRFMKRIFTALLAGVMLFSALPAYAVTKTSNGIITMVTGAEDIAVCICTSDFNIIANRCVTIEHNGEPYISISPIFEAMGYQANINEDTFAFSADSRTVVIYTGSSKAEIDGDEFTLSKELVLSDGEYYIHIQDAASLTGYGVQYIKSEKIIRFTGNSLTPVKLSYPYDNSEYADYDIQSAALAALSQYGIITGDESGLRLEDNITRAEMSAAFARLIGMVPLISPNTIDYTDVTLDHWAADYIYASQELFVVDKYEDGSFCPDGTMTYSEVAKMLLHVMGYKPMAEQNGGYPTGYDASAQKVGLLTGLGGTYYGDSVCTRKDAFIMIYNALDIPMMDERISTDSVQYIIADGQNGVPYRTLRSTVFETE